MAVNGIILKCAIAWKTVDRRVKRIKKLGLVVVSDLNEITWMNGNQGEIQAIAFLGNLPNLENIRHFDSKSPQIHYH